MSEARHEQDKRLEMTIRNEIFYPLYDRDFGVPEVAEVTEKVMGHVEDYVDETVFSRLWDLADQLDDGTAASWQYPHPAWKIRQAASATLDELRARQSAQRSNPA